MSCSITTNLAIGCQDETANAGFSKIFLKADKEVVSVAFGTAPAHTVTGVTLIAEAKFIEFNGRFATKSLNSEATKENGGVMYTHTIEFFVPKIDKVKAAVLQQLHAVRGFVAIVSGYEVAGANKQGLFFGFDKKIGADAFLKGSASQILEATIDGQNGYMVTLVGMATELTREFIGTIVVEDGASGTSVVIGS